MKHFHLKDIKILHYNIVNILRVLAIMFSGIPKCNLPTKLLIHFSWYVACYTHECPNILIIIVICFFSF